MGGFSIIAVRLFALRGIIFEETGGVEPRMQVPVFVTVIIAVVVGLVCLAAGAAVGDQRR